METTQAQINQLAQQSTEEFYDDSYDECWCSNDCSEYDGEIIEREDHFRDDVEADADALASAGYGTNEDYGGYGYLY